MWKGERGRGREGGEGGGAISQYQWSHQAMIAAKYEMCHSGALNPRIQTLWYGSSPSWRENKSQWSGSEWSRKTSMLRGQVIVGSS